MFVYVKTPCRVFAQCLVFKSSGKTRPNFYWVRECHLPDAKAVSQYSFMVERKDKHCTVLKTRNKMIAAPSLNNRKNHWIGARALVKLMKPKKEATRERLKSSTESPPWHSESTDTAGSPSPSQLPKQQENLENTSAESGSVEGREQNNGPLGKGRWCCT